MSIVLKSPREIELMRAAGRLVASVLDEIASRVRPGVTTRELDELAKQRIADAGAAALFVGVELPQARFPFPSAICASLNDEVVHGIPDDRPLREGDILSVDCGVKLNGYCGDSARTFMVGELSPEARRLMDVTSAALDIALREVKPGRRWSSIAKLMQACVEDAGFGVVRDFVGHGIGCEMHEEPKIPNYDDGNPRFDFVLEAGMALAIEPMVAAGSGAVKCRDRDGWTMVTRDGSLAAHFEHTVAVLKTGVDVLTRVG